MIPILSPTGSSLSSESSPVSSPATNHSSPASTPKRVPMGPIIVPPGGHSVPSTPPVVTIAPTKTVNGVWRSESRQVSCWGPRCWEGRHLGVKPLTPTHSCEPVSSEEQDNSTLTWTVWHVLEENPRMSVRWLQSGQGPGVQRTR